MIKFIVMEALSRLVDKGVGGQYLSGFTVSHLLFADDTLIFCGTDSDQIRYLRCVSLCLEAVSGLRTNLGKSELVLIGDVMHLETLVTILGCKISSLPMMETRLLVEGR
jgi:hypothetical protein